MDNSDKPQDKKDWRDLVVNFGDPDEQIDTSYTDELWAQSENRDPVEVERRIVAIRKRKRLKIIKAMWGIFAIIALITLAEVFVILPSQRDNLPYAGGTIGAIFIVILIIGLPALAVIFGVISIALMLTAEGGKKDRKNKKTKN